MRTTWRRGEKAELARRSGLKESYLHDLLAGRRSPSPAMAEKIELEAFAMGLALHRMDLLYPRTSDSPLMNSVSGGKR